MTLSLLAANLQHQSTISYLIICFQHVQYMQPTVKT